ncbi:glycosyltransferase family 4 protein [Sulfurospirillum halorespirans]|uniref:Glycosyltransferase n=1 Tax=Sulfurospirillum halorespirans DSM 13726 TaxID=1193502 RepID=A0A1D7TM84_9BACT|nr:glycosyltransferase [Sulfurospirillum halorespirans]AOO66004.1 glycosyltransferase [Sulfurospirillum halorespirans DSM 13726]
MLHYLFRHNKDYSRFNIIKHLLKDLTCKNDIFILLPFSKNQFFKHFFKRNRIVNDFFISNYDTYVNDREKISPYNPRAWWKYLQDWVNFKFSKYLLCDTQAHFDYWQKLFGTFKGEHFVLPVLADTSLYYPAKDPIIHEPKRILFYGSFIPLHGIDVILKAFALLEKEQIAFQAQVIGKGQMFSAMKALYEKLHLCNVEMNGLFMNEQALVDEIRKADIVLGIFGHSQKAFSVIPNKAYQALACQKALITMTTPTMYEFFNDHEILMCPNTPEALAEAMKKLINDTALLQQYQTNGYQAFSELYQQTQKRFEHFIHTIDQSLGS